MLEGAVGTLKTYLPPLVGLGAGYMVGPMIIGALTGVITTNAGQWVTADLVKWILFGVFVAVGVGSMFHGSWIMKGIGGALVGIGIRAVF